MPRYTPLSVTEYGPSTVGRRRVGNLAVFLLVATAAAALGYLPWQVPVMLTPWLAGVWLTTRAMHRASSARKEQGIETASYCLDAAWLTGVCFFVGGAHWLASAFYVLLVITAAGSLPIARAVLVAGVAWIGFAWLALGQATGAISLPEFGPTAGNAQSFSFALLTVVIQGTTLALALLLQQSLLGALRRSEARHRAILNAASDMVVVLDRNGLIRDASEVFAQRTTYPIRGLVGRSFADIVDSEYRETWTRNLGVACSGEHAAFDIAYRSAQSNRGWISGTLVPLPAEDGEERVLMIARDVSADQGRARPAPPARPAGVAAPG